MQTRWPNSFTRFAGLTLIGLATAHFIGNQGAITLQPEEPIFQISSRWLFWVLAGCELCVGAVCLFGKSMLFANLLILWLMSNLVVYRLGLLYCGVETTRAYYVAMADGFGVSSGALSFLSSLLLIGLCAGSGACVLFLWKAKPSLEDDLSIAEPSRRRQ